MARTEAPTQFHRLLGVLADMEKTFCRSSQAQHDQAEQNMISYAQKTKDLVFSHVWQSIITFGVAFGKTGTGIGSSIQAANDPNAGKTLATISDGFHQVQSAVQPIFSSYSVPIEKDRMFLQDAFQRQMQEHQGSVGLAKDVDRKRDAISEAKLRENRGG